MSKRYIMMTAVLLVSVITFSSCPTTGSPAVGAWAFSQDAQCDETPVPRYLLALYADNTAELFIVSAVSSGTWLVDGSTITIAFPDVNGSAWVLTGTLGTDLVTDGMYTIDGVDSNCWTAERVVS